MRKKQRTEGLTPGTDEFAAADIADMMDDAVEREHLLEDKARARKLFEDAGKPVPEWAK